MQPNYFKSRLIDLKANYPMRPRQELKEEAKKDKTNDVIEYMFGLVKLAELAEKKKEK